MRVVCLCRRGNVRSDGLAYLLKDFHGCEAVAIGYATAGDPLKAILFEWADRIIVMQPYMIDHVWEAYRGKVRVADVGDDTYEKPHGERRWG